MLLLERHYFSHETKTIIIIEKITKLSKKSIRIKQLILLQISSHCIGTANKYTYKYRLLIYIITKV